MNYNLKRPVPTVTPVLTHGHAAQPSHLGNLRHLGRAEDVVFPLPRVNGSTVNDVLVPVNQGSLCGPIDLDPSRAIEFSFDLGSVWGVLIWTLRGVVIQRLYGVT